MLSCRIAQLRRSTGLNQSELAQKLHVSPSTIGMYEQGRRTPNVDVLIQMSQIFNVSLDYLITGLEFFQLPNILHGIPLYPDVPVVDIIAPNYPMNNNCCPTLLYDSPFV